MRISIWQQFASNHSADFIIVGTFETESAAQQTAEMLRDILRRIAHYWQQLPSEEAEALWKRILYEGEITPIERELSQELGVEWSRDVRRDLQPHGIDWIPWDPDRAAQAVTVLDHHVFIENIGNTDVGSQPFEALLRRYATTVVGDYETTEHTNVIGQGLLRVQMTCRVPDIAILNILLEDITVTVWHPPEAESHWLKDMKWKDYAEGHYDSDIAINIRNNLVYMDGASVKIQGLEIAYSGLTFGHPQEIVEGLRDYLNAHGCLDIRYEFSQE